MHAPYNFQFYWDLCMISILAPDAETPAAVVSSSSSGVSFGLGTSMCMLYCTDDIGYFKLYVATQTCRLHVMSCHDGLHNSNSNFIKMKLRIGKGCLFRVPVSLQTCCNMALGLRNCVNHVPGPRTSIVGFRYFPLDSVRFR